MQLSSHIEDSGIHYKCLYRIPPCNIVFAVGENINIVFDFESEIFVCNHASKDAFDKDPNED